MTDDPHPASAAWQDVKELLVCGHGHVSHYCPNCDNTLYDVWPAIERARAADAQQIAEAGLSHRLQQETIHTLQAHVGELQQQIAALRAENADMAAQLMHRTDQAIVIAGLWAENQKLLKELAVFRDILEPPPQP